jgi:hypothetical protein
MPSKARPRSATIGKNAHANNESRSHQLKFHQLAGFYDIVRLTANAPVPAGQRKVNSPPSPAPPTNSPSSAPLKIFPLMSTHHTAWTCLKLERPFPFLANLRSTLVDPAALGEQHPIFAISTPDAGLLLNFPT